MRIGGRVGHSQRYAEDRVGAEASLVGRAVELDHRLVDALLVFDVHSDHALHDLTEHALDSLGDAFPSIPFGIAVAQLDRLMHAG